MSSCLRPTPAREDFCPGGLPPYRSDPLCRRLRRRHVNLRNGLCAAPHPQLLSRGRRGIRANFKVYLLSRRRLPGRVDGSVASSEPCPCLRPRLESFILSGFCLWLAGRPLRQRGGAAAQLWRSSVPFRRRNWRASSIQAGRQLDKRADEHERTNELSGRNFRRKLSPTPRTFA